MVYFFIIFISLWGSKWNDKPDRPSRSCEPCLDMSLFWQNFLPPVSPPSLFDGCLSNNRYNILSDYILCSRPRILFRKNGSMRHLEGKNIFWCGFQFSMWKIVLPKAQSILTWVPLNGLGWYCLELLCDCFSWSKICAQNSLSCEVPQGA